MSVCLVYRIAFSGYLWSYFPISVELIIYYGASPPMMIVMTSPKKSIIRFSYPNSPPFNISLVFSCVFSVFLQLFIRKYRYPPFYFDLSIL